MEKIGTVATVCGGIAEIKITRDSACGENCAACGLCQNRELTVKLTVPDDIKMGDTVKLVAEDAGFLKLSAIGYLSLTLFLILGGVIGTLLKSEWLAFALAVLFPLAGIFVLKKVSPKNAQIRIEKV
jgi:sigma-E factor negative regulatory protein RseC